MGRLDHSDDRRCAASLGFTGRRAIWGRVLAFGFLVLGCLWLVSGIRSLEESAGWIDWNDFVFGPLSLAMAVNMWLRSRPRRIRSDGVRRGCGQGPTQADAGDGG